MFILKSNFEIRKNLEKKIREIEKELFSFQKNVLGQDIDTEKHFQTRKFAVEKLEIVF